MKYIKTFESKYRYLNGEDTNKLKLFVDDYIKNKNLPEKIKKLTYDFFEENTFNYEIIFDDLISSKIHKLDYSNIYYDSDEFCIKNNISISPVENRNSLGKLIDANFKKHIKYFDDRVIELIKRRVKKYEEIYNMFEEDLSPIVKKTFQYILDVKKYNL